MITIPTLQELQEQIVTDYETELGQTIPLLPKTFIRVWAKVRAGLLYLAYRHSLWVLRQAFVETCDLAQLEKIGRDYRLSRVPPQSQIVQVQFDGLPGTTLPTNRALVFGEVTFITRTSGVVPLGGTTLTVEAESQTPGLVGAAGIGDSLLVVQEIAGLAQAGEVMAVVREAENEESLTSFRQRVLEERRTPPQGGAIPDWVRWTREVPGVANAIATREIPGNVVVYPLMGFTESDRIPTLSQLAEVTAYITDPIRRPLNCLDAEARAFRVVEFDVTISNLTPDTPEIRQSLTDNITAYMLSRFPRQYVIQPGARDVVGTMDIYNIARDLALQGLRLQLDEVGGSLDINFYQLAVDELAKIRNITFV
jgi:uncharacterized phage protein gp47/JayE